MKDSFGVELQVGDNIIFATNQYGTGVILNRAEVIKLAPRSVHVKVTEPGQGASWLKAGDVVNCKYPRRTVFMYRGENNG